MEECWKNCVERLLRSWTGYQLALEMQCAGALTNEKALWFSEVLAEHVAKTHNLQEDELIDWIDDILYVDFDLVLEDNSSHWIATSLLKCIRWVRKSQMAELNDFLAELPSESAVKKAATESRFESDDDDDSEVDESGVNERMDDGEGVCEDKEKPGEASQMSPSKRERVPRTITDDDGWTTILPRK